LLTQEPGHHQKGARKKGKGAELGGTKRKLAGATRGRVDTLGSGGEARYPVQGLSVGGGKNLSEKVKPKLKNEKFDRKKGREGSETRFSKRNGGSWKRPPKKKKGKKGCNHE